MKICFRLTAAFSLAASLLSACGPTVRSSLPATTGLPISLAVLPPEYTGELTRERIDLVRSTVISELRNNNYIVADDKLVLSTCSTPACPERTTLADRYSIDGFVTINVRSFSKNNFLAGYYNALAGSLTVTDKSGKELVNIDYKESERGGVIFQSGQVLQGIIAQVKHSGDQVFEALANKFARRLVEELPTAQKQEKRRPEETEVALTDITAIKDDSSALRICAKGTPSSFGFLILGKSKATLREVTPGMYCGAFSPFALAYAGNGAAVVELRSAFGNSVQRNFVLPVQAPCSLADRVTVVESGSKVLLNVLCATVGKDTAMALSGCNDKIKSCSVDKLVLYKAAQPLGPYTKSSEIKSASASLPATKGSIQAVAVASMGVVSLPVALEVK